MTVYLSLLSFIVIANLIIVQSVERQFIKKSEISEPSTVLVLGADMYIGKYYNSFTKNRVDAVIDLYNAGKVKHILLSGDNHTCAYNEPQEMKNYLVENGVPPSIITLDYAGFRTFDSMYRSKHIFGAEELIVISQKRHLQRALFIANHIGLDAHGYAARDVHPSMQRTQQLREYIARTKTFLDVYLLPTKPKFLGVKESLN